MKIPVYMRDKQGTLMSRIKSNYEKGMDSTLINPYFDIFQHLSDAFDIEYEDDFIKLIAIGTDDMGAVEWRVDINKDAFSSLGIFIEDIPIYSSVYNGAMSTSHSIIMSADGLSLVGLIGLARVANPDTLYNNKFTSEMYYKVSNRLQDKTNRDWEQFRYLFSPTSGKQDIKMYLNSPSVFNSIQNIPCFNIDYKEALRCISQWGESEGYDLNRIELITRNSSFILPTSSMASILEQTDMFASDWQQTGRLSNLVSPMLNTHDANKSGLLLHLRRFDLKY